MGRDGAQRTHADIVQLSMGSGYNGEHHETTKKAYQLELWIVDHKIRVTEEGIEGLINITSLGGKSDHNHHGGQLRALNDKCFKSLNRFDGDRNKFKRWKFEFGIGLGRAIARVKEGYDLIEDAIGMEGAEGWTLDKIMPVK